VNAWLKYTWYDAHLQWNAVDFDGVTDVRFRKNQLWKPDVLLYNSVDADFDATYATNMLVYHNGLVSWIPPGIFKISCHIDITWLVCSHKNINIYRFPFDDQQCSFKFGSWTYDGAMLDLREDENGFDLSNYMINGEWNLYNISVARNIQVTLALFCSTVALFYSITNAVRHHITI
jgi:hypothetical protein